jgi:copper chaperone CopZ
METVTLDIKGMTCMGCVNSVTRVLKAAAGVSDAHVTLDPARATVQYDAARTDPAQLRHAVEEAGYDAE